MTDAQLKALASGTFVAPPTPGVAQYFVPQPNACSLTPQPGPTVPSTQVDLSQLIQNAKGLFEIYISTSSSTPDTFYALGGGAISGSQPIISELYDHVPSYSAGTPPYVPASGTPFSVDTASFLDGFQSAAYASAGFADWLNDTIFPGSSIVVGIVTYEDLGGTAASFTALQGKKIISSEFTTESNWESTAVRYSPNQCGVCENATNDIIQWTIAAAPIGVRQLLGITIPGGSIGMLTFCVQAVEASHPMTPIA